MCGIAGLLELTRRRDAAELARLAATMAARLVHRGPDDAGAWSDGEGGIGLGFQRLAILDLGPEGHQPMASADGRWVIVLNGEIYNFRELRMELEAHGTEGWRGGSDTEVALAAISRWGVTKALEHFDGMFAFALWDAAERVLYLARDRMGEKPLYYGRVGGAMLFASELKALTAHPDWQGQIDREAVAAYMRYGFVPAPLSIYAGIAKLPPGHLLRVDAARFDSGTLPKPVPYWDAQALASRGFAAPFAGTGREALDRLDTLLSRSVRRRMIADVPLGAFLSGGVDSSLIAALMQAESDRPVQTYTVGFDDPRFDESEDAAAVAAHLGTDHTAMTVSADAPLALVERMPDVYDEPFGDASQLPTLLLCEMTRRHVTTALSGDGGDELFGGYPRYASAARQWMRHTPVMRGIAAMGTGLLPFGQFNRLQRKGRPLRLGDKLHRHLADVATPSAEALYERYISRWPVAHPPVPLGSAAYFDRFERWPEGGALFKRFMHADAMLYLPDDLLVKIDRASMAVGLETRAPLLSHEVVEFAWSLPLSLLIRSGRGKALLRALLYRYVPRDIVDRPKQGFEPPLGEWLRGPLRDWAEPLLAPQALAPWLDPRPVRSAWAEHLAGHRDRRFDLWTVLMFQAWRQRWQA